MCRLYETDLRGMNEIMLSVLDVIFQQDEPIDVFRLETGQQVRNSRLFQYISRKKNVMCLGIPCLCFHKKR